MTGPRGSEARGAGQAYRRRTVPQSAIRNRVEIGFVFPGRFPGQSTITLCPSSTCYHSPAAEIGFVWRNSICRRGRPYHTATVGNSRTSPRLSRPCLAPRTKARTRRRRGPPRDERATAEWRALTRRGPLFTFQCLPHDNSCIMRIHRHQFCVKANPDPARIFLMIRLNPCHSGTYDRGASPPARRQIMARRWAAGRKGEGLIRFERTATIQARLQSLTPFPSLLICLQQVLSLECRAGLGRSVCI
jgi:hypothetical protein